MFNSIQPLEGPQMFCRVRAVSTVLSGTEREVLIGGKKFQIGRAHSFNHRASAGPLRIRISTIKADQDEAGMNAG